MADEGKRYFQKKRISIVIDPIVFTKMQKYRSLYLLSGKTLVEIPTITDFVNGMLVYVYPRLREDYYRTLSGDKEPYLFDYVKEHFNGLEVERELDKEEYQDFIDALPEDNYKTEIETWQTRRMRTTWDTPSTEDDYKEEIKTLSKEDLEIKIIKYAEERNRILNYMVIFDEKLRKSYGKTQKVSYNLAPLYEPQTINMILSEEIVVWARKINRLLNEIFQNRAIYSLSDIVKATVNAVTLGSWSWAYAIAVYIPHLYGIELSEYFEFRDSFLYGSESKVFSDPKYRNLIPILADKPIFDEFDKILSGKLRNLDKLSPKKISKLVEEVDNILPTDRLWSYVTNFNYKKAMVGLSYFQLALMSDLSIPDIIDALYNGRLEDVVGYFEDSRVKPYDNLNKTREDSYEFFQMQLKFLMDTVYPYSLVITQLL